MFIINITYKAQMEKIDQYLAEHVKFLDEQYELGNFLASGRKVPRTGGIILSDVAIKCDLEKIIEKDPFFIQNLAYYDVIEFVPSKTSVGLKFLMKD